MDIKESNTVELKQSWQDSYLKTLAAFANTDGGTMYIGVDDNGGVIGVSHAKKLLEDLPNKILSKLGIIARVQPRMSDAKETLKIIIEKMDVPISYKGKYYVRSGSTTQELNGKDLTRFLIAKSYSNRDEYPVPNVGISGI